MDKGQQMSFVKRYEENLEDIRAVVAAVVKKDLSSNMIAQMLIDIAAKFIVAHIVMNPDLKDAIVEMIQKHFKDSIERNLNNGERTTNEFR